LLSAVALIVGTYGLFLALARGPAPVAAAATRLRSPRPTPGVTRLPPLPDPRIVEASFVPPGVGTGTVEVTVLLAPPADEPAGGIGILASETGTLQSWTPLAAAERTASGRHLRAAVTSGAHFVCVADDMAAARCSYVVRRSCRIDRGGVTAVELDARRHAVVVTPQLGNQDLLETPFRLRRTDDPDWHGSVRTAFVTAANATLPLQLATGDYQLTPVTGGPWQPFTLQVAGPAAVVASFTR